MISFKDFLLKEAVFKKSKKIVSIPWGHLPMFTLYSSSSLPPEIIEEIEYSEELMKYTFEEARKKIHQLGFPSMHANVVFKDLKQETNTNTGARVGGYAYGSPKHGKGYKTSKYMEVDADIMLNNTTTFPVDLIVHEWAHLWMFKHHKEFKEAIKEYYQTELTGALNVLDKPYEFRIPSEDETFSRNSTYKGIWSFGTDDDITSYICRGLADVAEGIYYGKHIVENTPEGDDNYFAQQIKTQDPSHIARQKIKGIILGAIKISNDYAKKTWEFDKELDPKYYNNTVDQLTEWATKTFVPLAEKYVDNLMKAEKEEAFYSNTSPIPFAQSRHTKHLMTNDYDTQFNTVVAIDENMTVPETISWTLMDMIKHSIQKEQIEMLRVRKQTSGKVYNDIRKKIASIVNWVSAYGMSDEDEMWATAMEKFLELPREHRSKILKLMMS